MKLKTIILDETFENTVENDSGIDLINPSNFEENTNVKTFSISAILGDDASSSQEENLEDD